MRRAGRVLMALEQNEERLVVTRITPAFIGIDEAARALAVLQDRLDDPMIMELIAKIAWLMRPTILPG